MCFVSNKKKHTRKRNKSTPSRLTSQNKKINVKVEVRELARLEIDYQPKNVEIKNVNFVTGRS